MIVVISAAHFGRGKGPVWLDNMRCAGNESRLQDCAHNSFAVQNCNHGEDAGVYCTGDDYFYCRLDIYGYQSVL